MTRPQDVLRPGPWRVALNSEFEEELDRAQSEAKAAFHRAKRIVIESRALLLNQAKEPGAEAPATEGPPMPRAE